MATIARWRADTFPSHITTITKTPTYTITTTSPISYSPTTTTTSTTYPESSSASSTTHTTISTTSSQSLLDYAAALNTPCSHGLYATNFPYHVIKCWVSAEVVEGRLDASDYWEMCRCVDDVIDAELEQEKQDVDVEDLNGGRLAWTRDSLDLERNQKCYGSRLRRRQRRWARKLAAFARPWSRLARKHRRAVSY